MSSDLSISVQSLSKCYQVYDHPSDRLKQFLLPRLARMAGGRELQFFKEFWALQNITFEVRKGESVGILGKNGSGKSTLLQLITGTLTPTAGSIMVDGAISALLELGSGFNPEFTGRENVILGGALNGWSAEQTQEKFANIASFADIGEFMDMPVKTYSSGMYARLAFSAAIHSDPEILIVDEILAVGDASFQSKCIQRIYRMMDEGVSVLLVSHDAYQVRSICQKALVLDHGTQMFFGSAARAMDEYLMLIAPDVEALAGPAVVESQESTNPHTGKLAKEEDFSITIHDVEMSTPSHGVTDVIHSGDAVKLRFGYRVHGVYMGDLSFVVNLYRDDGVYIFGATTAMRNMSGFSAYKVGWAEVEFPSLMLVSGSYKWRVAINDGRGLHILTEAVPVCPFKVEDDFRAVGLVDIDHIWSAGTLVEKP